MEQFHLRPYTPQDAQAVVDVINAASMLILGFPRAVVDAIGNIWAFKYVPFTSEKVVVTSTQGHVIGYAYFSNNDNVATEMGGAVHPAYRNQGVGSVLIAWAESRAKDASQNVPVGIKTVLQSSLFEKEYDAIKLYKDHGYAPVREWVHLAIEMNEQPVISSLPGLTVREMDLDNDWDIVGPAMDEAFTDHWGYIAEELVQPVELDQADPKNEAEAIHPTDDSYSNSPGYCFIVLDGETVVGGILCNAKLIERNDTGRVGSIFVRPAYRKRGIAKTLMLTAFDAFWINGVRRVITDTDANSFTDSTRLYKGLGMEIYRSEFTFEKEIRSGRDVRRLEV
jgi:mycothiol synthase